MDFMTKSGYLLLVGICPSVILRTFLRKGFVQWLIIIWTRPLHFPLKISLKLTVFVNWCDISPTTWICNSSHQVSEEFPILLNFEGNWVVHDYLRIYLKNSAQRAKKDQQQRDRELEAAAKGKGKGKAKGVSLEYTETTGGSNILRSSSQITN